MYQILTRAPYLDRLLQVATDGAALYERAARGEPMGPRELAQAIELSQQYVDILAEMEDGDLYLYESEAIRKML